MIRLELMWIVVIELVDFEHLVVVLGLVLCLEVVVVGLWKP